MFINDYFIIMIIGKMEINLLEIHNTISLTEIH